MRLKCPACGATFSLDVLLTHDGAREALMAAMEIPAPLGKLLVQYLALFRPASRDLSFDRVHTLLSELLPMIKGGQIDRNGRTWPAPLAYWQSAIEQMLVSRDKLQLPMKSHGYLLEIIAGMGNKTEAIAEAKREETRRQRVEVYPTPTEKKKRGEMPDEFRRLVKQITGKDPRPTTKEEKQP